VAFNKGKDREEELKNEAIAEAAKESSVPVDVLAKALENAMNKVMGAQNRPRVLVPFGQHSVKTAFNPQGKKNRKVNYLVFQNGYRINPKIFTDEEIALVNSGGIKPGRYLNNVLRVVIQDADGVEPQLHFIYKNQTADQRMALGTQLTGVEKTGFARMCRLVIDERAEQDKASKRALRKQMDEAAAMQDDEATE
jgi:hypothetical protein